MDFREESVQAVEIKKRMQAKHHIQFEYLSGLFLKCGGALIAGTLLSSVIAWWAWGTRKAPTYGGALGQIDAMQASLAGVTILCTAAQVILAIGLLWAIGIYASNKIAGPLVRFERCVRELGGGNLAQTIQFRAGDQDQSLPSALQSASERLRGTIQPGRETAEAIAACIRKLEQEGSAGLSDEERREVRVVMERERERLGALSGLAGLATQAVLTDNGQASNGPLDETEADALD